MPLLSLLALLVGCTPSDGPGTRGATPQAPALDQAIHQDALMGHLEALQAIADANGGNRASGTSGFAASADYAEGVLVDAGYTVTREPFEFSGWEELGPAVLELVGDPAFAPVADQDIAAMTGSLGGDVTAPLAAVDLVLPPTPSTSSTSGCEASDFAGFPAGSVALIQRGACLFADKARNAQDAGAAAVIVFNEGQSDRRDLEPWTLDADGEVTIPVLAASFAVGDALAAALAAGPVTVRVATDAEIVVETSENLLAETAGDPDRVVVVGGHLDSVPAGPGINDNGSGTALVLELAVQLAASGYTPRDRVRFALWGSEELGLLGSIAHVSALDEPARDGIVANLNFDMVASPNGSAMVYDGDGSAFGNAGPDGSAEVEALFEAALAADGVTPFPTFFDGRSDYGPFLLAGIAAGGLFSGAEEILPTEHADVFGGVAGEAMDPCYHEACDTLDNVDADLFLDLARAAAATTLALADGATATGQRAAALPTDLVGTGGCSRHALTR